MTVADEGKLEPAVVAALYLDHADELRRFLVGLLRDHQLAADVLQATFTRAIEQGHTARVDSRKGWLFRVAYREAIAVRRRETLGERVRERIAWGAQEAEEPVQSLIRFETVEVVREALRQLPPDQNEIVRMRIFEEKTFAAIAAEKEIPLGTALARMRAALKKLHAKLQGHHES